MRPRQVALVARRPCGDRVVGTLARARDSAGSLGRRARGRIAHSPRRGRARRGKDGTRRSLGVPGRRRTARSCSMGGATRTRSFRTERSSRRSVNASRLPTVHCSLSTPPRTAASCARWCPCSPAECRACSPRHRPLRRPTAADCSTRPAGLLAAAARRRPVLLVFDDLHWADAGTVALLRELVQRGLDVPLLVVATYRTTDVERHHPSARLLVDLRREPGVTRVALEGLTEREVGALLAAIADQPLGNDGAALAASLRSDTGGNPFFIIEVLQHLIETGAVWFGGGQWVLDTSTVSIPEGIREVVGRRLDLLGEEVTETLRRGGSDRPRLHAEGARGRGRHGRRKRAGRRSRLPSSRGW